MEQHRETLRGMEVRVVPDPMGHQVSAIRPFAEVGVKARPQARPAEVGQERGGTGKELEIDRRVHLPLPQQQDDADDADQKREKAVAPHRHHVLGRDHVEDIDDETVVIENNHEDVVATNALHGLMQGQVGQDRRALLGELDEDQRADWSLFASPREARPQEREAEAEWNTHPAVDLHHFSDVHRKAQRIEEENKRTRYRVALRNLVIGNLPFIS
jgi:hypothetical protein